MSWAAVALLNPCTGRKPTAYSSSTGSSTPRRPFLGPDLDSMRLLVPEIAAVGVGLPPRIVGGVIPCRHPLQGPRLVHDPGPRYDSFLARLLKQAVDALHLVARHRRDGASRKQFIPDTAPGDRLRGRSRVIHRLDQVQRLPCAAATQSQNTQSRIHLILGWAFGLFQRGQPVNSDF